MSAVLRLAAGRYIAGDFAALLPDTAVPDLGETAWEDQRGVAAFATASEHESFTDLYGRTYVAPSGWIALVPTDLARGDGVELVYPDHTIITRTDNGVLYLGMATVDTSVHDISEPYTPETTPPPPAIELTTVERSLSAPQDDDAWWY